MPVPPPPGHTRAVRPLRAGDHRLLPCPARAVCARRRVSRLSMRSWRRVASSKCLSRACTLSRVCIADQLAFPCLHYVL
eukprot:474181-Pleurochrysis_carterae.AAC.3